MNYSEAMDYVNNTAKFGMNLGLQRIEKLMEYMGNPQDKLRCIHVGGTNGKGSITTMISSILKESGYKTGIYTSPYLQRFSERIKINDEEISKDDIARLVTYIKPLVDRIIEEGFEHPTEFEIITAVMFQYFYEKGVDLAVIEVGLGGRLDSTNVINPLVSVITSIDYDHMAILGNTLGKIAYEKSGIIKKDGIAVTYPQDKEVYDVLKKASEEKNARLIEVDADGIVLNEHSLDGQVFDFTIDGEAYEDVNISLLGQYQLMNAKTAVTAVRSLSMKGINIDRDSIYRGLHNAKWPGRLEVMRKDPIILLDGAHNLQGVKSLKEALIKYFKYERLIVAIGILKDRQIREMCDVIMPMADKIITTTPQSDRALPADELGKIALEYCGDVSVGASIDEAFAIARNSIKKGDLLVFCGSLYMIGHVRTLIEDMM